MSQRLVACALCCAIGGLVVGCESTSPSAGVSDFGVFTAPHLIAAEVGTEALAGEGAGSSGPFTDAEMRRYFETPAKDYDASRRRMDMLLDNLQGQSATLQAAQSSFSASLAVTFAKSIAAATQAAPAPTPNAATPPTNAPDPALVEQFQGVFDELLKAPVADSPFDQLDRVADFFAAYIVKKLRVRGDSRAIDPWMLKQLVLNAIPTTQLSGLNHLITEIENAPDAQLTSAGNRLVLVLFQSHVFPGNLPNTWTGVRIKITGASGESRSYAAADVKVIRLHPTHTYDVDQVTSGESAQRAFALAGSARGSMPGVGVGVDTNAQGAEEEQERRKFLTRITKVASFADAGEHAFGFNFYPSNVEVRKRYIPLGFLITGQATTYDTKAYLEGGARDCAAILVVPRDMTSFTCKVRSVWGQIDGGAERGETDPNAGKDFVVTLPKWTALELAAATIGAGPTTRPTTRPATPPTAAAASRPAGVP